MKRNKKKLIKKRSEQTQQSFTLKNRHKQMSKEQRLIKHRGDFLYFFSPRRSHTLDKFIFRNGVVRFFAIFFFTFFYYLPKPRFFCSIVSFLATHFIRWLLLLVYAILLYVARRHSIRHLLSMNGVAVSVSFMFV